MERIITITTDYGDTFALSQLEGVVLSINKAAKIVVISNTIKPFSIIEGAFVIKNASKYFPKDTIHLGIVDPGVGTDRGSLIIETEKGIFVGPDNGLFYPAICEQKIKRIIKINENLFDLSSSTFHGRDIFAKVAGYLSLGEKAGKFGKEISISELSPFDFHKNQVVHIDSFGNIKLSSKPNGFKFKDKLLIFFNGRKEVATFAKTFGDVERQEFLIYKGSHETLEIAKREDSAASFLSINIGDTVNIEKL